MDTPPGQYPEWDAPAHHDGAADALHRLRQLADAGHARCERCRRVRLGRPAVLRGRRGLPLPGGGVGQGPAAHWPGLPAVRPLQHPAEARVPRDAAPGERQGPEPARPLRVARGVEHQRPRARGRPGADGGAGAVLAHPGRDAAPPRRGGVPLAARAVGAALHVAHDLRDGERAHGAAGAARRRADAAARLLHDLCAPLPVHAGEPRRARAHGLPGPHHARELPLGAALRLQPARGARPHVGLPAGRGDGPERDEQLHARAHQGRARVHGRGEPEEEPPALRQQGRGLPLLRRARAAAAAGRRGHVESQRLGLLVQLLRLVACRQQAAGAVHAAAAARLRRHARRRHARRRHARQLLSRHARHRAPRHAVRTAHGAHGHRHARAQGLPRAVE
mmetsp:Transcript_15934/g.48639  ORF Transcript_15934/g.48639 Transcript_15934/m.48639 type:complete len:392 (-) Transcript_15934:558-1733(-)